MRKIFIFKDNATCFRRQLDAERIKNYFIENSYKIVKKPEDADLIIFFTCAVTNTAVESALNKINEYKKYKKEMIVAGCLPEIEKEKLGNIFNGKVIGARKLKELDFYFPNNNIPINKIEDANILFENFEKEWGIKLIRKIEKKIKNNRIFLLILKKILSLKIFNKIMLFHMVFIKDPSYFVRIGWGCPGNCSFCATKKAVGPLVSKPFIECIEEFKKGIKKKFKTITIVADDCGAYGIDIGETFTKLMYEFIKQEGNYKIEIESFRPLWLMKHKEDVRKILNTKKISEINIPIQSGNKRILRLMNRYSDIENTKNFVSQIKKENSKVVFWTNCIVGFPTETEDEFKDTLSVICDINFDKGALFEFSCRENTEAEKIEPKVDIKTIKRRMNYAKDYLKKSGYNAFFADNKKFLVFEKRKNID